MPVSKYDIDIDLARRPGTSHAFMVDFVGTGKRVLDVGCDTGYLGEVLNARGNETLGFEFNPVAAEEAARRLQRVEVGDVESTDLVALFGKGQFDVVVFGDVLEHLRDPLPVLRSAAGLLAPGGIVLISTPNVAHGDVRMALLKGRFDYGPLGILDETHTRFFTITTLQKLLRDAGFGLVEVRRTKAELFHTEIDVHPEEIDPAVVGALRVDPEATTYQFVVIAAPEDVETRHAAVALELDAAHARLARVDEVEAALVHQRNIAAVEAAEARSALDDVRAEMERRLTVLTERLAAVEQEREQMSARLAEAERSGAAQLARRAARAYRRVVG